jgi:AsmA protein
MKKVLKVLFGIIAAVILFFAIACVLLVTVVDPNDFKKQISDYVYNQTQRQLVINGDISWSFFPWLGLRVANADLSNTINFNTPEPFAHIDNVDVNVRVLPLFKGHIEVGKITLNGLRLHLIKSADGQNNWQDLSQPKPQSAMTNPSAANNAATTPGTVKAKSTTNFSISSINIKNSALIYTDQQKNQSLEVTQLQLQTSNISSHTSFPFNLEFHIQTNQPAAEADVNFYSKVLLNLQEQKYALHDVVLEIDSRNPKNQKSYQTKIAADAAFDLKQELFNITNLSIKNDDIQLNAKAAGSTNKNASNIQGNLSVSKLHLKNLLAYFGKTISTKDPNALQNITLQTLINGGVNNLTLSQLKITLDNTNILGKVIINDYKKPNISFDLGLDSINIDQYLSADSSPSTSTSAASSPASTAKATSAAISKANPTANSSLVVNGNFRANEVIVSDVKISKLAARIGMQNNVLSISPFNASIYGGNTTGQAAIDFRGAAPRIIINQTTTNVPINAVTKSDRLTGNAMLQTNLVMQGNDANSILSSMYGTTQFTINNAVLHDIDLHYQINRALSLVKKQPYNQPDTRQTEFGMITGSGTFSNGVFNNNSLTMQSSYLRITGNGTVNLLTKALNYHLIANAMHTTTDAQGHQTLEQRQFQIPLSVTGTVNNPSIVPDLKALAAAELQSAAQKIEKVITSPKAGEAIKNLQEKVKGGLLNKLLSQ